MFKRAFARAELPLRHSEGFNPHPRISVVLPRPVGVASEDELLVVELESADADAAQIEARLCPQLPPGAHFLSVMPLNDRDRMVVVAATHRVPFAPRDRERVATAARKFDASQSWKVERTHGKRGPRSVDIRGFVTDVAVHDDCTTWRQDVSQDGTARVDEMLDALSLPARDHLHRVVRTRVECRG